MAQQDLPPLAICIPENLAAIYPCAACMQQDELEAGIIFMLQTALQADTDVNTTLEATACFTCFSDKQLLESVFKILLDAFGRGIDPEAAVAAAKCWKCATPKQRHAALVAYICRFVENCANLQRV